MRRLIIVFIIALTTLTRADSYVSIGLGFTGVFYKSHDINQFTQTYNLYNHSILIKPLQSFDNGFGLRWEVGYRRINKMNFALNTGYLSYVNNSTAEFDNQQRRDIKFSQSNFFIETEVGYNLNKYLINGVVTFHFNRNSSLESSFTGDDDDPLENSINGTYKTLSSFALDLGIAFGIVKAPFLIVAKISYPVATGGSEIFYRDQTPEKVQNEIDGFPRDYFAYAGKEPYPAVRANIDGVKFFISLNYMIPLKSYNSRADQ